MVNVQWQMAFLIANYIFVRIKANLFDLLRFSHEILQFSIQKIIKSYLCL